MLAIGRALMRRPRLLLVDELSLGLAPVIVSQLYTALRALCERGLAVLVAEQFQRFEARYFDRWVVLERGTIVAAGGQDDAHLLVGS
jgi:branched-chain amino acid transport system ATP-binding protein